MMPNTESCHFKALLNTIKENTVPEKKIMVIESSFCVRLSFYLRDMILKYHTPYLKYTLKQLIARVYKIEGVFSRTILPCFQGSV